MGGEFDSAIAEAEARRRAGHLHDGEEFQPTPTDEPMWTITIEQPDGSSLVWITEDPDLAASFQAAMTDLTGARGDYVAP